MSGVVFRLAAAILAFLIGFLANQAIHHSKSTLHKRRTAAAASLNHSVAQGTGSALSQISRDPQADSLTRIVASLHRIKPLDDNPNVPPEARRLITSLKHQLRDLIAETLNAQGNQSPATESLRAALWDQLATRGIQLERLRDGAMNEDASDRSYTFGEVFDVDFKLPAGHDDLIAVTTILALNCGSDASLYIFQRRDNKWILALAQEANEYENISGAQGRFEYAISPADTKGDFFVVTVNINPWCTSNWQALRYSVMQIGSTAYQHPILAAGEETIYLGVDSPVSRLEVAKKWFSITFEGNSSDADVANGINSREHVLKYLIQGQRARKVSG